MSVIAADFWLVYFVHWRELVQLVTEAIFTLFAAWSVVLSHSSELSSEAM